jgi:host factor-I protein
MSNQASIQDEFLQSLLNQKTPASVYLVNGIRLSGAVVSFDSYVVVLQSVSGKQMIFKHAISTVMPSAGVGVRRPVSSAQDNQAESTPA